MMAEMEQWWEAGDFRAERAEALERLRALIGPDVGNTTDAPD